MYHGCKEIQIGMGVGIDKAGAYGIQEHGDMLLAEMNGELENVIGLPIRKLQKLLMEFGCK